MLLLLFAHSPLIILLLEVVFFLTPFFRYPISCSFLGLQEAKGSLRRTALHMPIRYQPFTIYSDRLASKKSSSGR
ncbi:uncharacterized protein BDW43DRAFT_98768 [Aspergillus alliaceus]|uniref:uncharacterized protein n=1 Tax=Petromyces alliaceus TaxID=209559 RepID=UPI0012A3C41E|nr:uncharacterized protein BDW43DRAFT_98768 [Aspergillus alliaceus]KAB8232929.1 hypothetical protein BDW43DRAFT_98768 [Aspergillus alliaceus]